MRVLISGASGLVGTELIRQLNILGHEPLRLVRRSPSASDEVQWNPATGFIQDSIMDSVDAVVNLAGATTGKVPWTKKYKIEIVDSRLDSTRTLVKAIEKASNKPKVLISGSASGFYGEGGETWLSESSPKGEGFLSDLSDAWEKEALKAKKDTRVVLIRTTLVMSRQKGALGRLLPLIKWGIGGPLGTGKQYWAWINLEDEAAAIIHLIENQNAEGPYNLTAPEDATCADMIHALGKALKRPTFFRVPGFAMKLLLGEAAQELLLVSQRMTSDKLVASGYKFKYPTLESSVRWVVSKN